MKWTNIVLLCGAVWLCGISSPRAITLWDKGIEQDDGVCGGGTLQVEHLVEKCEYALKIGVRRESLPMVLTALGDGYAALGRNADALLVYRKAIQVMPTYLYPYYQIAAVYETMKSYTQAVDAYGEIIKLGPNHVDYVYALRCWDRAIMGYELDAALADCNESLRLKPDDTGVLDSRGFVQLRRGDYAAAIADASAALAKDPKMATSLFVRGLAKLKSGDAAGGNADIAAAKALDPKIADTYAGYGVNP